MALELVLVGGGHAHVQVLRRFMMQPVPGVSLSVVLDRAEAVYSGMVPGLAAGDYAIPELEIDVVPLARRAGARCILAPALRVDPRARRIELEGRPAIGYDVASLDVGSTVRGLELPGVREHALATRPIRSFADRLEARLAGFEPGSQPRLLVVGGGAAGVELAFALRARLAAAGARPRTALLCASAEILPRHPAPVSRRLRREAAARGIELRCRTRAVEVEKDAVRAIGPDGEERVACDLAVWATGAEPVALLAASPLPRDEAGFVRVTASLRVEGCDDLFAVGDCAALRDHPWVPKAGVYAVRQGPVLDANLRARARGGRLRAYRPQRDFLSLLHLGEGRALGAKWGLVAGGRGVWRLKDRIDRRFVRRFQVLGPDGAPSPHFPGPESMGAEEMACGGCAAKVAPRALERALARLPTAPEDPSVRLGLLRPDDAAALEMRGGELLLATVDGFRAFCDDPWLVGGVAAVNAVSDVYCKGGRPRHALALVTVPEGRPERAEEILAQVLAGVRGALDPLGCSLVGGHSTLGPELFVGLSVTGDLPAGAALLPLGGARPGDRLLLSKPLGTGVVLAADMRGLARGAWVAAAHASMLRPNDAAARVVREAGAHACTDVSGFGLAGHLGELLRASGAAARLDPAALPALPGARELLAAGLRSSFHDQNAGERLEPAGHELAYDPQTSGGLLFALPAQRAEPALRALRAAGERGAAIIGKVGEPRDGAPQLEFD